MRLDAAAERRQHGVDARRGVGDGGVDLAGRLVALVVGHQVRQRPLLLAERGQHVQRGQHARVGTPEVAEVVVRRVLAAEDRAGLGHQLLDVGVPDARAHRRAATLGDQLRHRARGDQVVDHRRADLSASSRAATRAVTADGETGSPCSSTTKQRSASPSNARPMSAPVSTHVAPAGRRGSPGPADWPRGWGTCRRVRRTAARA